MTAPATIPQAEITRIVRGALEGGMTIARVRVDLQARVVDIFAPGSEGDSDANPWDDVLTDAPLAAR